MFNHNLIELPSLERIDGEVRYYKTPGGMLYPSATTVLSAMSDETALDEWRNRVGHDEAEKITKRSSSRGTKVHEMCEKYILNQPISFRNEMPFDVDMFRQIKRVLDKNVDDILVSEGRLYSDTLKVAGSVDLVAKWKGVDAIIDFKTSMKSKDESWIDDYKKQVSMYSFMLYEMFGILCNKIVIIIAIESENNAQVFEDSATNWLHSVKRLCKEYHKKTA